MFLINTSASNVTSFSYIHLFFVHRYSINITSTCTKTELTVNKYVRIVSFHFITQYLSEQMRLQFVLKYKCVQIHYD